MPSSRAARIDADGDLAPVGDQDLLQHGCQCRWRDGPRQLPSAADGAWPPGWTVEHVSRRRAAPTPTCWRPPLERPDRSVLVADHQTAGKGRLDRRWDAPPGANLLVSFLFRDVPADPGELMRRVALAAVDACRRGRRRRRHAEVAQRPARRRAQAGRDPRRAPPGRTGRRRPRAQRRLGARRRRPTRRRHRSARRARAPCSPPTTRCPPTSVRAVPRTRWRRSGGRCASSSRRRARRHATDVEPDGRLVVVDACAVTHRLAVGDVDAPASADASVRPEVPGLGEGPPVAWSAHVQDHGDPPARSPSGSPCSSAWPAAPACWCRRRTPTEHVERVPAEVQEVLEEPSNDAPAGELPARRLRLA